MGEPHVPGRGSRADRDEMLQFVPAFTKIQGAVSLHGEEDEERRGGERR